LTWRAYGAAARMTFGQPMTAHFLNNPYFYDMDQSRNMASLKEVKKRIKSVKAIQKITKSMKLVATTRLKKAEEGFEKNEPSYLRLQDFLIPFQSEGARIDDEAVKSGREIILCLTTERGLCGSVNSSISRAVKRIALSSLETNSPKEYIILGNKGVQSLTRNCGEHTLFSATQIGGRSGPKFIDILPIAERLTELEFDKCTFIHNRFINLLTFNTIEDQYIPQQVMERYNSFSYDFDSGDKQQTLLNFHQWYTAVMLYSSLSENNCIEVGQRMSSMDNATKNAGELIKTLTRKYNRRRQSIITTEISEIISGAAAVEAEDD